MTSYKQGCFNCNNNSKVDYAARVLPNQKKQCHHVSQPASVDKLFTFKCSTASLSQHDLVCELSKGCRHLNINRIQHPMDYEG